MLAPKGIIWLSSYPKSGNTWFRIVLSRILNKSSTLNYINDIDTILGSPMVTNRSWMNKTLGYDSTLLHDDEIDQLRPEAYKWYAEQIKQTIYIKTHDAYTRLTDQRPLIPQEGCLGAIYFIRNPLDVAISLAHHAKCPIDWSIQMMGNQQFSVPLNAKNDKQIRQQLLSWSQHVQSWVTQPPFRILVLRYEDMFFNPIETFNKSMEFLKLDIAPELLKKAIDDASFDKLQQHEQQYGFKEKLENSGTFFRKGVVGDWQNTLTKEQVERIIHNHEEVMRTYGYLDEYHQPIKGSLYE